MSIENPQIQQALLPNYEIIGHGDTKIIKVDSMPDDKMCEKIVEEIFQKFHHTIEKRDAWTYPYCIMDKINVISRRDDERGKGIEFDVEFTVVVSGSSNVKNEKKNCKIVIRD